MEAHPRTCLSVQQCTGRDAGLDPGLAWIHPLGGSLLNAETWKELLEGLGRLPEAVQEEPPEGREGHIVQAVGR